MKKLFFTLMLVLSAAAAAGAQDIITMKDGRRIEAKVLEISSQNVRYRMFDEPDGVVYAVPRSGISSIKYESGRVEDMASSASESLFSSSPTLENEVKIVPGMRYRDYMYLYRPSDYVRAPGDPYSPAVSGIVSALIPGLGQMICGEIGRGFAILGVNVGVPVVGVLGTALFSYNSYGAAITGITVTTLLSLGVYVWNIVDAVQVAQIKNMYRQDLRRAYSFGLDLYPSVNFIPSASGIHPAPGITLALNF